jgi:hypothetical protein
VSADGGGGVDDGSKVCNLVGISYMEELVSDCDAFRTRLVLR